MARTEGFEQEPITQILGWKLMEGTLCGPRWRLPDSTSKVGQPTADDLLAWLRRRCSTIRIDPIRTHEVGYTLDCTDETEPMQPNRIMASVTAPTFHAALEIAVRAVAETDDE